MSNVSPKFNTLVVMRGVSGSGKSTIAKLIAGVPDDSFTGEGPYRWLDGSLGVVLSTDLYFIDSDGEYRFDPSKIAENHTANQASCEYLMKFGEPLIVIDNTNTQVWEMAPYVKLAKKHGYKVVITEVPHPPVEVAAERNSHGVPVEAIRRMIDRWESKLPGDWSDHAVRKMGEVGE